GIRDRNVTGVQTCALPIFQFPLVSIGVVQSAMLSRSMKFKHVSLVNFVVTLGNGFTTLGFALSGAGVWALVYGSLAGSLIRSIEIGRASCRERVGVWVSAM